MLKGAKSIDYSTFGHDLLVTFDHKGVRIREVNETFERVDISELPLDEPEFTLTHA